MTRHPRVIRDTYGEQPMVNVDVAIYVAYINHSFMPNRCLMICLLGYFNHIIVVVVVNQMSLQVYLCLFPD